MISWPTWTGIFSGTIANVLRNRWATSVQQSIANSGYRPHDCVQKNVRTPLAVYRIMFFQASE